MDTVLQFSGGKDSLACLYLNRDRWDSIYVMWVNTGAAYQETIDFMEGWKEKLPHFIEVKTNQPAQNEEFGIPADVVPITYTYFGRKIGLKQPFLIQSYAECCGANIWFPMRDATKGLGVTNVIRGQRADEKRRAPYSNGYVFEGITYWLPIEQWTAEDVFRYLREQGAEIPAYYSKERTSHDCWDCTAYLDENVERIQQLPASRRTIVLKRVREIVRAVGSEVKVMENAYGRTDLILQRD